jgi:hypothetical protein
MKEWGTRREEGAQALLGRAVRIPLLDLEAEQRFHETVERIRTAIEGKADLLADPDVPVTDAYEHELEEASANFEHRLQQLAGESYDDVANAYLAGERDDWVAHSRSTTESVTTACRSATPSTIRSGSSSYSDIRTL